MPAPCPAPNPCGGPSTPEGRAISSQNSLTHGLYATRDFVRPGEEPAYQQLGDSLHTELAPVGILQEKLVNEIRRALWRLDRCGDVEQTFLTEDPDAGPIPDPMRNEAQAKLQISVDRARAQSHRLLHKCTAELRKLQTERRLREESFEPGADLSRFGLSDWAFIRKALDGQFLAGFQRRKLQGMEEIEAILATPPASVPNYKTNLAPTPRNAPCPCGSGQKHKRCCGKNAPPLLHAA